MQRLLRIKAACPCHMNCYLRLLLQRFPQREKQSSKGKSSVNGRPIAPGRPTKTSAMGRKGIFAKRLHISSMQNSLTVQSRCACARSYHTLTTIIWPVTLARINYMSTAGALSFICCTALSGTPLYVCYVICDPSSARHYTMLYPQAGASLRQE